MKNLLLGAVITGLLSLAGISASLGEAKVQKLDGLKEGETRVVADGDTKVTATRKGDTIQVTVTDKEGAEHKLDVAAGKGEPVIVSLGGSGGTHRIEVTRDGNGEKEKKVMVIASASGSPEDVMVLDMDDDGPGMAWHDISGDAIHLDEGGVLLRCPEGDTTMHLQKDDTKGTYYCPKHNVALEEHKGPGYAFRTKVIRKEIEERTEEKKEEKRVGEK